MWKDISIGALVVLAVALLYMYKDPEECKNAINRKNTQLDKLLDDKREVDIDLDRCKKQLNDYTERLQQCSELTTQLQQCKEIGNAFKQKALSVFEQYEYQLEQCETDLNGYGKALQLRLNLFGMFSVGAGVNNPLSSHQLGRERRERLQ